MKSKQALVPKLRFGEFGGGWTSCLLDEYASRASGHTPSKSHPEYYGGDIQWISLADSNKLDKGYISDTKTKITPLGIKNSSAVIHPAGTVIVSRDAGVGKSAVMKSEMAVSQHFIVWRPIEGKSNTWFLYYWLQIMKPHLERIAIGSTIKTIGLPYFKKLAITTPSLPEQEKIAAFLTSVDDRIDQLKRKKSLLQDYKKGAMQKLFSQELRFKDEQGKDFPDWEEKKLGELCKITTGKLDANAMKPDGDYRFYTCAKEHYMIDVFAFDTEALLISGNGANVGYIHYYKGKFNAYQRTYVLDGFSQNITFIQYVLQSSLKDRIDREKKAGNTPYIVMGTLTDMKIALPSLPEQIKIANLLSSLDQKIEQVDTQITQTQTFKKGLLQQMFV